MAGSLDITAAWGCRCPDAEDKDSDMSMSDRGSILPATELSRESSSALSPLFFGKKIMENFCIMLTVTETY